MSSVSQKLRNIDYWVGFILQRRSLTNAQGQLHHNMCAENGDFRDGVAWTFQKCILTRVGGNHTRIAIRVKTLAPMADKRLDNFLYREQSDSPRIS